MESVEVTEVRKEQELHTAGGIGTEQDCENTETCAEIDGDDGKMIILMETLEAYDGGFFRIYAVDLSWRGE